MTFLGMLCSFEFMKLVFVLGVAVFCYFKYQGKKKRGSSSFFLPFARKKPKRIVKQKNGKHESRCREILENIYGKKFESVRPEFLRNPKTGRRLELDCYNEELKLALEYDGVQHSKYSKFFHKTPEHFVNQARRDLYKDKAVKKNGY
ncbi:putative nuclease [Golden Marseillevirus]|uniref:putative nuclease n=1 Tax=Golden Marseillevirus TaxID=1720526 RepID=UPI000877ADB2|nr:putative nuclease [Golden Marseillevirus]ALX27554.1 putative nuclease [Golden Marseillevirus]